MGAAFKHLKLSTLRRSAGTRQTSKTSNPPTKMSSSEIKKVVLVGAAGNVGSVLLPTLKETFEITILTRPDSTATFPAGVAVVKAAYTEDELVKVFQGQDAIVSAVGAAGFLEQKTLIDAAVKAGVKRFLPSEFSSNTLSDTVRQLVPIFEPKKMVLEYLKSKESTGLSWTGLAVGGLFDSGLRAGFLGFDLANKKATIWDGGNSSFSLTNQGDVGKAIIGILENPAETANKYLYVSTVTTTQSTILKSLEVATGEKWTVENVETEKQIALGQKLVSEGEFTGFLILVQATGYGKYEGIRNNYSVDEKLANVSLGLPAEGDVDATVKAVVQS